MRDTLERLQQRRALREDAGFTLIELLIVIVILGILAAIVVFAVNGVTGSSAKSACQSDYKTVETATEAYNAQTNKTATDIALLTTTANVNGQTVGPWLNAKDISTTAGPAAGDVGVDTLTNANHYQVAIAKAKGTITVFPYVSTAFTSAGDATNGVAACNIVK